ncbi:MAG: hypothetical protein LBO08_00720 [Rickettsiales bacterium]|jgi:hypothetical protein|nr:hypothetical protein [Rickettsiales bacterium]
MKKIFLSFIFYLLILPVARADDTVSISDFNNMTITDVSRYTTPASYERYKDTDVLGDNDKDIYNIAIIIRAYDNLVVTTHMLNNENYSIIYDNYRNGGQLLQGLQKNINTTRNRVAQCAALKQKNADLGKYGALCPADVLAMNNEILEQQNNSLFDRYNIVFNSADALYDNLDKASAKINENTDSYNRFNEVIKQYYEDEAGIKDELLLKRDSLVNDIEAAKKLNTKNYTDVHKIFDDIEEIINDACELNDKLPISMRPAGYKSCVK